LDECYNFISFALKDGISGFYGLNVSRPKFIRNSIPKATESGGGALREVFKSYGLYFHEWIDATIKRLSFLLLLFAR
jgi:hypothetical protein